MKKIIRKGAAAAAFASVAAAGLMSLSLGANDIAIDKSQEQQETIDFHGISAQDAMIAVYSSYFSGTDKDTGSFNLDSRAGNTFGMNDALAENFTGNDAPWVMLDSLSDGRNNSNAGNDMQGAHFVAMYHKDSQQVVITMPGMEYDYAPSDTLDDAKKLFQGNYAETQALKGYVDLITDKMQSGEFQNSDGGSLEILNDKPIIASHSLGSKATHVMSVAGYQTIMLEPRPITDGYVEKLRTLYDANFETPKSSQETIDALDANTISIRAGHANVWNSPLMPWTDVHNVPDTYIYGTGDGATLSDRHVAGDHGAEVAVPSIMRAMDSETSASQAPKGKAGMRLQRLEQ
jgi:hypothetical protein